MALTPSDSHGSSSSSFENHHRCAHRGRCEQEVSILFPEQPSAPLEHIIWHVLGPRHNPSFPPWERRKRKKIQLRLQPASFRDQRHPPTALEWIIDSYFSSPAFLEACSFSLCYTRQGACFQRNWNFFLAFVIRYLSLHVNLGGLLGSFSLSFILEFSESFVFDNCLDPCDANEIRVDFCIYSLRHSLFLFVSLYTK